MSKTRHHPGERGPNERDASRPATSLAELVERAYTASSNGEMETAETLMFEACRSYPSEAGLWGLHAKAAFAVGETDKARLSLLIGIVLHPHDPVCQSLLLDIVETNGLPEVTPLVAEALGAAIERHVPRWYRRDARDSWQRYLRAREERRLHRLREGTEDVQ